MTLVIRMEDELLEREVLDKRIFFGERIRTLRNEYHFSQDALAEAANITSRTISDIENGVVDVKLSTVIKLAFAFSMSIAELLTF